MGNTDNMDEMDKKIKEWVEGSDNERCRYCIFNDDCPKGMVCYGGEPIEPPCCSLDYDEYLDLDWIAEDIESGEIEV